MSRLATFLQHKKDPGGVCIRLLLIWLSLADGRVDDEEYQLILSMSGDTPDRSEMALLTDIVTSGDMDSFETACRLLQEGLKTEYRELLLEMAVGVAIADGRLSVSENHVLRFLADLLNVDPESFGRIYRNVSGSNLPPPANLSSANVWNAREASAQARSRPGESESASRGGAAMSRLRALAILGLEEGASIDEVKRAYRHLAKVHHPDRFESLGPDAVKVANATFARIQLAYDYLTT